MRALPVAELLKVWERGFSESPARRALLLLEAGCDDIPPEEILQSTIGRRDALLLALHEKTFGSNVRAVAACPACGEQLEAELDISTLRVSPPSDSPEEINLCEAGHEIRVRRINSADLAGLSPMEEAGATRQLLKQCLLSARSGGREIPAEELPEEVVARLAEKMAQCDPQADLQLGFSCPACGHAWQDLFDIASFFWAEINVFARRRLREVHVLATAYGWSESEILRLSPLRRSTYLQLLGA